MDKEKILAFCSNNEDAVRLIFELHHFFCIWDDVIDQDKKLSDNELNQAFIWALFGMECNPFYAANKEIIKAAMLNCISLWLVANKFESTKKEELLHQSFVMRCSPYNLYATIVLLTGGISNQTKAIEYFYSLNKDDSLALYLNEHKGV